MENSVKLAKGFIEVLQHEGVVAIVSWGKEEPHLVNTWNSYLVITEDGQILIPAYGFRKTEENVQINNRVKLTAGSPEVLGLSENPGTGFLITGTARFITSGPEVDMMIRKFSFPNRVLEITVESVRQTL
jgi:hypothetical protein